MSLKNGLISYWKLDEASGDALDAHGSNDLTETSGTIASAAGVSGVADGARDFEAGDTEYFAVANNADLTTGDIPFTFLAWINAESLTNFPVVFRNEDVATREYALFFNNDVGVDLLEWQIHTPAGAQIRARATITTATWYMVVCEHDPVANTIGITLNNGTPQLQTNTAGVRSGGATEFQIGASSDQTIYWDGLIGPVALWKRLLTAAEKTFLYNGGSGRSYDDFDFFGQDFSRPFNGGPPMAGAAWFVLRPDPPLVTGQVPDPPATPTANEPSFFGGPPVPGAPWLTFPPVLEGAFPPPSRGTPATPTGPGRGKNSPLIPRVPKGDTAEARERMRRVTEMVADRLNSLVRTAELQFDGLSEWVLRPGAHAADRDPTVDDDKIAGFRVGAMWVNQTARTVWTCISNAVGAADWKQTG